MDFTQPLTIMESVIAASSIFIVIYVTIQHIILGDDE